MQPILSHHLSLTSCWASPQPQHVWRNMFFQTCIQSQTCSFCHTEDAKFYMTCFFKFWVGMESRSSYLKSFPLRCLILLMVFVPRRQSLPSNWMRENMIILFVSDQRHCFQRQCVMTETTWGSFGTLSMCRPLKTLLHFPHNVGFVSFSTLGDWSSSHHIVPNPEVSSSEGLSACARYSDADLGLTTCVWSRIDQMARRHCFQWLIHDWNYMDSILPLSSQRLFDSWSLLLSLLLHSGLWRFEFSSSDQHEVLQMSSILNYSVVHCFAQFLGRTKLKQSEADQSRVILTCLILPWPFP